MAANFLERLPRAQRQSVSTYLVSVHFMFTSILLAKANHMANSRVIVGGATQEHAYQDPWFIGEH